MTSTSRRILAALTLSLTASFAFTACGAPTPTSVCVGPETPDDLEDLVDRDIVRHPDAACSTGNPLFSMVSVSEVPEVGEELGEAERSSYHASPAFVLLQSRSVNRTPGVQRPPVPTRAAVPTRPQIASPAPKPSPRSPSLTKAAPAPSRANQAPVSPPKAKPAPAPKPKTAPKARTSPRK